MPRSDGASSLVGAPLAGTSSRGRASAEERAGSPHQYLADVLRTASDLASANPLFLAMSGLLRVVGDVCDLLTLGLGTLVNWIHCDGCDAAGKCVSSHHYSAITKPFSDSHPLLCRSIPGDLERFVEGCFPMFHELRGDRELHALTHAFAEARGHGFLDARTLIAVSLIDHLTGIEASRQGKTKIIKDETFQSVLKVIQRDLRKLLKQHLPDGRARTGRPDG